MENIKQIIIDRIKELKITTLDISFNELADMYDKGELIIQPEYQRTFRWDLGKQSRFIETLLLEMPVPPIYVIELEDGMYELIDGLQRISSYLSYRGLLKLERIIEDEIPNGGDDSDEYVDDSADDDLDLASFEQKYALYGCDIIKELNGMRFEDLQAALQIKLKRSFVRIEVLRYGINPEMKYHMFKRLNTGGEKLEPQEIRNCSIRLIDDRFINFIKDLKTDPQFRNTITLIGTSRINKRFDEELVLRFFAFKNSYETFRHNVGEFLTQYMEAVSTGAPFDYSEEKEIFQKTFRFLNEVSSGSVFRAKNQKTKNYGVFNAYLFEAITVGVQEYLETALNDSTKNKAFSDALDALKDDKAFRDATVGGGKNSPSPMNIRREKVKEMMERLYK